MTLVGRTTNMINALRSFLLAVLATAALTSPAFAQGAIKIGVLTPLSPPGDAAAGQFIVRGAKMAAEEINGQGGVLGGRKIELIVEDDAGTPEKGAAGLRKLVSQDHVVAVVGQFHSSVTEAVQDLAEQLKVPVFLTQASAKKLTEKHLTYTFRTHVIDPDRVTLWNKWIQQQGFKRVAILAENTDLEEFQEPPRQRRLQALGPVMVAGQRNQCPKGQQAQGHRKGLLGTKFTGWNGTVAFTRGDGPYWQQWTPPMLFLQYTKPE